MKSKHHAASKAPKYGIVRRGGVIALPPGLTEFQLGQRVFFHVSARGVAVQARPKGLFNGRLPSSRVRRVVRSLALYGPRAGTA